MARVIVSAIDAFKPTIVEDKRRTPDNESGVDKGLGRWGKYIKFADAVVNSPAVGALGNVAAQGVSAVGEAADQAAQVAGAERSILERAAQERLSTIGRGTEAIPAGMADPDAPVAPGPLPGSSVAVREGTSGPMGLIGSDLSSMRDDNVDAYLSMAERVQKSSSPAEMAAMNAYMERLQAAARDRGQADPAAEYRSSKSALQGLKGWGTALGQSPVVSDVGGRMGSMSTRSLGSLGQDGSIPSRLPTTRGESASDLGGLADALAQMSDSQFEAAYGKLAKRNDPRLMKVYEEVKRSRGGRVPAEPSGVQTPESLAEVSDKARTTPQGPARGADGVWEFPAKARYTRQELLSMAAKASTPEKRAEVLAASENADIPFATLADLFSGKHRKAFAKELEGFFPAQPKKTPEEIAAEIELREAQAERQRVLAGLEPDKVAQGAQRADAATSRAATYAQVAPIQAAASRTSAGASASRAATARKQFESENAQIKDSEGKPIYVDANGQRVDANAPGAIPATRATLKSLKGATSKPNAGNVRQQRLDDAAALNTDENGKPIPAPPRTIVVKDANGDPREVTNTEYTQWASREAKRKQAVALGGRPPTSGGVTARPSGQGASDATPVRPKGVPDGAEFVDGVWMAHTGGGKFDVYDTQGKKVRSGIGGR